jgi:hypothetical protein
MLAVGVATAPPASADASTFRFTSSVVDATEGQGTVRVVVERTDLPVTRTTVDYRTEPGTALAGSDFEATRGTLVFEVGTTSASFLIVLRDDAMPESIEELSAVLGHGVSGAPTADVRIFDDDTAPVRRGTGAGAGGASAGPDDGAGASSGASATGGASAPVAVAAPSPAAAPRAAAATRPRTSSAATSGTRRVTVRQSPVTPFELRAAPVEDGLPGPPAAVDPILAVFAALLVGRVAAEVWFRLRAGPA